MTYPKRRIVPVIDRVMAKVVAGDAGCWLFTGTKTSLGYGTTSKGRRGAGQVGAHRVTYEFFRSEIPDGLVLDHLCRTPSCVNPWHLEPVTNQVNVERGDLRRNGLYQRLKTHCVHGHEFTTDNTLTDAKGHRRCRTCTNARALARYHSTKGCAA